MDRMRLRRGMVWLSVLPVMAGCQSQRMVQQYLGFDMAITDVYEKHVLHNLARRDQGNTMVQMSYNAFSGSLTDSFSSSGQVSIFTNAQATGTNGTSVTLNAWQNVFQPSISSASAGGLSIGSVPADNQDMIRALYDEQVNRLEHARLFGRTSSALVAMRSYCWVRMPVGDLYYVRPEKHREFADFVHKVCFYKFVPPPPQAPATAPAVANARP